MRSQISLPAIIGILAVGLFFSNIPLADAMQDMTIKKIKIDKKWSKMTVETMINGFTDTQLSDFTVSIVISNEVNDELAFSFVNAKSLEEIISDNLKITKIKLDAKGKMKIESKISGLTKTNPSDLIVAIQVTHSNGEVAFAFTHAK
jgi:hypothetical protein